MLVLIELFQPWKCRYEYSSALLKGNSPHSKCSHSHSQTFSLLSPKSCPAVAPEKAAFPYHPQGPPSTASHPVCFANALPSWAGMVRSSGSPDWGSRGIWSGQRRKVLWRRKGFLGTGFLWLVCSRDRRLVRIGRRPSSRLREWGINVWMGICYLESVSFILKQRKKHL